MNGTEKIIAHIQADASAKADEILAEAKSQAESIKASYDKQAQEIYNASVEKSRVDSDAKIESMKRMSAMETKKKTLALKQSMVESAFDKAEDIIKNLPKDEYVAFLSKLAAKASVTGEEEVVLNKKDKEEIGAAVVKAANDISGTKLTLSDKSGDFSGGLILRRDNIEVNCTIKLLKDAKREELSSDVVKILFG